MKPSDNDKIKEKLSKTGRSFKPKADFEKWCRENPQAIIALKMRAEKRKTHKDIQFWRIIMRSRISKLAAAAVIIIAVVVFSQFGDIFGKKAYAFEQTIEAIDAIRTVHFQADFFMQGSIECWMKFDGSNAKPTHICLSGPGSPLRKLDTPAGNFAYNTATNRIYKTWRDERNKDWYIDFTGFFRDMINRAQHNDSVTISNQNSTIVIDMDEGDRTWQCVVDSQTKLPVSFETIEVKNIMAYLRQTIAVRNMNFIEYNKQVPEGIFDVPDNAQEVTNEHDIIVHPGLGLQVDGMDNKEACEKIMREIIAAMNERDWEKVAKLYFPFPIPPKEIEQQFFGGTSEQLIEIQELGEPYEKGDYWYIYCKTKEANGKIKEGDIPIKFYEFDGSRYCIVALPD